MDKDDRAIRIPIDEGEGHAARARLAGSAGGRVDGARGRGDAEGRGGGGAAVNGRLPRSPRHRRRQCRRAGASTQMRFRLAILDRARGLLVMARAVTGVASAARRCRYRPSPGMPASGRCRILQRRRARSEARQPGAARRGRSSTKAARDVKLGDYFGDRAGGPGARVLRVPDAVHASAATAWPARSKRCRSTPGANSTCWW